MRTKLKQLLLLRKNATISTDWCCKTEEVSLDFVSNGNFEPVQELKFSAEKSGKITKILAKEGDWA
jgi:hypothetical protein